MKTFTIISVVALVALATALFSNVFNAITTDVAPHMPPYAAPHTFIDGVSLP